MKNTMIRGSVLAGLCLCAQLLATPSTTMGQPFTTVINVPPDPAPGFIGSDTQLNLFDGGILQGGFSLAGTLHGLNSNIEVNVEGGAVGNHVLLGVPEGFGMNSDIVLNINGGTVGNNLTVNAGGVVNINGGTVGDQLEVNAGGTVNLNGGTLGDRVKPRRFSTFNISGGSIGEFFEPGSDTTVNISGGAIGDHFSLGFNTTLSISGGVFQGPIIHRGGTLNLSGGNFDNFIWQSDKVNITGSEFRFNGELIPGLESAGGSVPFPTGGGFLTTTFADGAVLAFNLGNLNGTLNSVAAPAKPTIINSPSDPEPLGLRAGQTLNMVHGAELVNYFTAIDSTLHLDGGIVGEKLRVFGTSVDIKDGSIGDLFWVSSGSTLNISGGEVGYGMKIGDSYASISGGNIGGLDAYSDSIIDISGGIIRNLDAHPDSTINIKGLSFILNGIDITQSLSSGETLTINDRDVNLDVVLVDGSPFATSLNTLDVLLPTYFDPNATLTITLVPEPGTLLVICFGATTMIRRTTSHH